MALNASSIGLSASDSRDAKVTPPPWYHFMCSERVRRASEDSVALGEPLST